MLYFFPHTEMLHSTMAKDSIQFFQLNCQQLADYCKTLSNLKVYSTKLNLLAYSICICVFILNKYITGLSSNFYVRWKKNSTTILKILIKKDVKKLCTLYKDGNYLLLCLKLRLPCRYDQCTFIKVQKKSIFKSLSICEQL